MILRYLTFLLFCLTLVSCADEKAEENTGKQKMPVIDEVVSEAKLEALNGEEIFNTNCLSCHAAGPGHPGTMRLAIRLGEEKSVLTERTDLNAEYVKVIVRQGILLMPPFRPSEITDDELEALAIYLTPEKVKEK